jgi:sulfopyruvate decarboxylase subunit alpha
MGKATTGVLDALEITYFIPKTPDDALKLISKAGSLVEIENVPVGILLEISFW